MPTTKQMQLAQHCQAILDRSDAPQVFGLSDLRRLSRAHLGKVNDAAKDTRIIRAMKLIQSANRHALEKIDATDGPLWIVFKDAETRHFAQSIGLIH